MGPRRRDADDTRARILTAARAVFSTHGYREAGVREIALRAGTSPALVSRYFGSKEGLFEAALAAMLDAGVLTGIPRETFGRALLDLLTVRAVEDAHPLTLMMLSASDPRARAITERLLRDRLAEPLARWFGTADADERAARLLMLTAGLVLYRSVVPLPVLVGELPAGIRAWLEGQLQDIVDQPDRPISATTLPT